MATVLGKDCSASAGNVGVMPCIATPGQKVGHIRLDPDWSAPITDAFDKAYFNDLVQQGIAKFFGSAFGVTTETADPTLETSSLLLSAVVNRALPMVTGIFKNGYEWHAGAFTNSGYKNCQIIEIFQDGSLRVALSKDGQTVTGFQTGMYEVLTVQDAAESTSQQTRIMYQLTDLQQYNTQGLFLTNLDFNPNTEINNIVDVAMTGRADISDNNIYVKTPWLRNPNQSITSFAAANFRLLLNGVENAIVGAVTLNGANEWVIEPTTAVANAQSWVVQLYDDTATPEVAVAKVGSTTPRFYAGQTAAITPVA